MALNSAYLNAIADHGGGLITHVGLADGPNEVDELDDATIYARQSITWNAAVDGDLDSSGEITFDVPGGSTVSHVQFWSAATGGTFYGSSSVTSESFAGDGTYTLTDVDINHNAA